MRGRMKMYKISLIFVLFVSCQLTACAIFPRLYLGADKVHGTVIDSETKSPLEGVIVLEMWEQMDGYEGGHYSANLVMNEAVTNEIGYYEFEGWGPRFTMQGHLGDHGPTLVIYKYGYEEIGRAHV